MKIYKSNSSTKIKIMTLIVFIVIVFVPRTTIMKEEMPLPIYGAIGTIALAGLFLYFKLQSLKEVILDDNHLVLQKVLGRIAIDYNTIERVTKAANTGIPMTSGFNSLFGFTGKTMDDSIGMVKDKSKMVYLVTSDKKYLISCDDRDDFINELNKRINR